MATFAMTPSLYDEALGDLEGEVEQVGFFLAEFEPRTRTFSLKEWRRIPAEGFDYQGAYHVALTDEAKNEMIQWAWRSDASLVEAHSHGAWAPAQFSPSDLSGFEDWVPHLAWRLNGRPYAALVTARGTFDALAWVEAVDTAEQVRQIQLDDGTAVLATCRTLSDRTNNAWSDEVSSTE